MRLDRSELSKAVQTALSLGAVAAVGITGTAFAQNATTTQNNQKQPQTLQTIVVTGSHIRRVDLETANPVTVVTAQQIAASGKLTMGDLIQHLPSIGGSANNPSVSNGGGTGGTFVSLRGLGSSRTLILIDGHRVINADINAIPAEMVERVEVLKDGASSVYGSDAIGGVVNFIMKKNYQGADFQLNYGISDRGDAQREGYSFTFGQTTDKGSIIAGIDYNKFDGVSAASRDFSKNVISRKGGKIVSTNGPGDGASGSAGSLSGYLYPLTSAAATSIGAYGGLGCGVLTSTLTNTTPASFRCFNPATDHYNYQAVDIIETPQERTNGYFLANYNLTDNVQAYLDVFVNRTHSSSDVGPAPMELYGALTVEKGQPYNPFPFALGGGPNPYANPKGIATGADFLQRTAAVGHRQAVYTTETDQIIAGLKGNIGDTGWQWDADLNYGHLSLRSNNRGYLDYGLLEASGDLNADCATNSADGCLNIFDTNSPASAAIMRKYLRSPFTSSLNTMRRVDVNLNGPLFTLPAGQMQLAVGADYDKEYSNTVVDASSTAFPATSPAAGQCSFAVSACSSPLQGGFSYKEAYAELYIPILKDLPFFHLLDVTLGDRYSKYSSAGSTNNYKVQVEWRPIQDLLLRGTVAKVFRAPPIGALYKGTGASFDSYTNPCSPGDTNPFCVAGGDSVYGTQIQTLYSGSVAAGAKLSPEYGKSFDFGVVYSPHFVSGLTLQADLWRVYLHNNITQPNGQTVVNICYASANPTNPYCAGIKRTSSGVITTVGYDPVTNLGNLWVKGVDVEADYRVPQLSWLPGQFNVSVEGTYLEQYNNDPTPGLPGDQVLHKAGTFSSQYGMLPRWRGLASLNWQNGPWQAYYSLRYVGSFKIGSADPSQSVSCDKTIPLTVCHFGSYLMSDVSVGYTIQPINTTFSLGVDNVFDKQPPVMYQNNTINANTDPATFDTIGRFYWARAEVKF